MSALRARLSALSTSGASAKRALSGRRLLGTTRRRVAGPGKFTTSSSKPKKYPRRLKQGADDGFRSLRREALDVARFSISLVCGYLCLTEHIVEPCWVQGPSMRPTIEHNSLLLVNKTGGRSGELEIGQIVLAQDPHAAGKMVLKRIAGLPGDSIVVRPEGVDEYNTLGIEKRVEVVPKGHVWLAGDNKENSRDSRTYGSVPRALVRGVAWLRFWPLKDFGRLG